MIRVVLRDRHSLLLLLFTCLGVVKVVKSPLSIQIIQLLCLLHIHFVSEECPGNYQRQHQQFSSLACP